MDSTICRITLLACALALGLSSSAVANGSDEPETRYYVSLGDSYASGFQPTGQGRGRNTRKGFAYQLPGLAARRGYDLELVNFGCGGATTTSLFRRRGCPPRALGPGGERYPRTSQLTAAERFLRRNRDDTELVTVSIGGNDVTACVRAANPVQCVTDAVAGIRRNLRTILRRLRGAAGPDVRIVGLTYPDVILGLYTQGDQASRGLAELSVVAFRTLINPALRESYRAVKARFVDVTRATGAYEPWSRTTTLAPYGTVPVAVAQVCRLTWFCRFGDIHAKSSGYRLIARLVAETLPRRR